MKILFRTLLRTAPVLLLFLAGSVMNTRAQSAKLQLDQLDALANRASDTVDIKLDEHLIQTTSKWLGKDEAELKDLLKNLKGIYVKSFSFEKENQYAPAEIDSVLSQLRGGGWNKIVGVTSKKDGDNVDVYVMQLGDQISGLAVVCLDPREITIVNIVGPVDLEKLTQLEGSFGVPDLEISRPRTKK